MYSYIYDYFLNHKKFEPILAKIETRLTDLGLNGKFCKQGLMQNIKDATQNEIRRGVKSIIAVGNDNTLHNIINSINDHNIVVGLIPINFESNNVAKFLGIPFAEQACNTIAARRIEEIDLIKANSSLFLSSAQITSLGTILEINNNYSIESKENGLIKIINLNYDNEKISSTEFKPNDGKVDILIKINKNKVFSREMVNNTSISLKELTINNLNNESLLLDNFNKIKTPVKIEVIPRALKIIVGKERFF